MSGLGAAPLPSACGPPGRKLRVCLCSFEIDGPKRGGIGTAYASLAELLAGAGHDVTLLLADDACRYGSPYQWQSHFAARGIRFEMLPPLPFAVGPVEATYHVQLSYRAYLYLRASDFDVVHFPDVLGLGYYSILAWRQGLAFRGATLCVGTHGPSQWVREGNRTGPLIPALSALVLDYLERRCVELAPVLVSPSAYMYRWMEERGWTVSSNRHVLQNLLRASGRRGRSVAASPVPAEELVFFGRLEARKGLVLFCRAVERLLGEGVRPARVTFLGETGRATIGAASAEAWARSQAERWSIPVAFVNDLDPAGAMDYLRGHGRLAVIASERVENSPYTVLECLGAAIPFVCTDVGGIPELIHADDRRETCVAPEVATLARRLKVACEKGLRLSRPAVDPEANAAAWLAWHAEAPPVSSPKSPAEPLVSVCVSGTLEAREAVMASLAAQGYAHLEVLMIDDDAPGARSGAALQARGEYVLFVSPGALLKPTAIERFVTGARHSEADVLTCCSETASAAGVRVGLFPGGPASAGLVKNVFGDAHAFFRRDALRALGGPDDTEGRSPDDRTLLGRAALRGLRLEVVPEVLIEHPGDRPRQDTLPTGLLQAYCEALPATLQDLPSTFGALSAEARAAAISRRTGSELEALPGGWLLRNSEVDLRRGAEAAAFVRAVLRSPAWHLFGPLRAVVLLWRRLRARSSRRT
jgi:glycosyltransferase involved in cell wall biosynthesis